MSTSIFDVSALQPSDFNATTAGVQDYASVPVVDSLASPTLDSSLGIDPLTGEVIQPGPSDVLTTQPLDASAGLNAVNGGLLPFKSPSTGIDPSLLASYGDSTKQGTISPSSGNALNPDGNLPLTTPNMVKLVPLAAPVATSVPMGSSIWTQLFGSAVGSFVGGAKSGTAGAPGSPTAQKGLIPGTTKQAPPTAIGNPISNTTMFLVLGVVSALIGAVIWSFSGK